METNHIEEQIVTKAILKHIAVDLDDVVLDFVGGVTEAVRKEYGVDVSADVNKWDLKEILNPVIGRSWWDWLRDREWLWATFPAIEGSIGTIDLLRREGYYMELLTSKPEWAEHNVWKWLGLWRPAFNQVTIVGPKERKVDMSNAQYLIDDKPRNLTEWVGAVGREGLLFTRNHNADMPRTEWITRVDSWSDIRSYFLGD